MASKKEHKRKQKAKVRPEDEEEKGRRFFPEPEINSLNLLSALHGVPKPAEGASAPAGDSNADDMNRSNALDAGAEEKERVHNAAKDKAAAGESAAMKRPGRVDVDGEKLRMEAEAEAAERARQEAAAAERAKKMAEEAERARLMAEAVERARREAEAAEQRHRNEERDERQLQEAAAAERSRRMTEAAERAKKMSESVERARREAEAGDRAAIEAAERLRRELPDKAATPAPMLEVENPYWEKPPEIFEMLSGAPHGGASVQLAGETDAVGGVIPVTMTANAADDVQPGFYDDTASGGKGGTDTEPHSTAPVPMEKRMYIVMVTPEVAPCAKVGGLGDVILGLGRELMKRGHGVEVICPMYSGMRYDLISDMHEEYGELWCPHYNEWRSEKVFQGRVEGGLQVNFITGGAYTERENIYGYDDDLQRFTYFSRQALEFMYKTNRRPDIIHCHDWATGLVPIALWDVYQKLGWDNSRVVYTIHNNECQGLCGFGDKLLSMIGLDVRNYHAPDRMQDDAHRNCINVMKGGIVYSNFVTTVSPTYAGELKSAAGGRGLQNTIAKNSAKVGGVLNGIDYDSWNPQTDPKLTARYSAGDDFFEKYKNKTALREWLGMHDAWKPILSVVTRLTHQKGLDLIKAAIFQTLELQGQFVLLGSAPDPKVNAEFLRLQHELRDNHDVNLYIGYHEDLSRLIYAGSDMFLVPSLYEPCGLTQMISLRYGTVPIVRETGGLVDTVFDLDNSGRGLKDANGFTFRDANPQSLRYGLERAMRLWYDNPEGFNRLIRNGMRYDYSWHHPAEHYENIYHYIKA